MITSDLIFCFTGERQYVRGTDIYNRICDFYHNNFSDDLMDHDLVIHKFSDKNMKAYMSSFPMEEPDAAAVFRWGLGDEQQYIYLLEDHKSPIDCRNSFDEEMIIHNSKVDAEKQAIVFSGHVPFSSIEIIVSMTKMLMQALHPEEAGDWIFTRLKLNNELPQPDGYTFIVSLERALGVKLVQSRVTVDDCDIGQIFFSLKKR